MLALAQITPWWWVAFIAGILVFVALDLFVIHRRTRAVTFSDALLWTGVCVLLAIGFGFLMLQLRGKQEAIEFAAGYIIELSLSMDNVFVIALIFAYFRVPIEYQHRVLFFGFIDALIMRGLMITIGVVLITRFHWILYVMGAFLIYSGFKMLFSKEHGINPEKNPIIKLAQKFLPVASNYDGARFFTRTPAAPVNSGAGSTAASDSGAARNTGAGAGPGEPPPRAIGRLALTPLAIVLLMVETTDLVFAIDSIPAIFVVTQKPFIVFTSNMFAILGLRSLYFVLVGALGYFRYLRVGLSFVLVFIGVKMALEIFDVEISTQISLLVVATLIVSSMAASILLARKT